MREIRIPNVSEFVEQHKRNWEEHIDLGRSLKRPKDGCIISVSGLSACLILERMMMVIANIG
jgi:prophage antirepressor-like protein